MSLEKFEDMTYQDCHSNDILALIDDATEQEYVEKWAPKAQEELLIINQDSDSSPTNDINVLSDEYVAKQNGDKSFEDNEFKYNEEIEVEKEEVVVIEDDEDVKLNEGKMSNENISDDVSELIDVNDPEIKDQAALLPESNLNEEHYMAGHELNKVCISPDVQEECSSEAEIKRSKDIKTINSSYNNEDNINADCEVCNKTVYSLEKVSANNHIYHKQCFRCSKCRCALLVGNFSYYNDKPYCKSHYIELFKKRGRYDERDDVDTTAPLADVNDNATDELPAPDITKNLLAKFRDLESGTPISSPATNSAVTHEMPAPNTTKNLAERFSALGKESESDKNELKRKPMIEIPRSEENDQSCGASENEPVILPKDVVRSNDPGQDEMPEQGITKNLVNRFRDMEGTGVASK